MRFLALFLLIPLIEVVVFIQVGGQIGALWTILLTLATAVTGITLVKTQGVRTFYAAKSQLAQGEAPAMAVVEGILLLLAGVMLMIPGFVSDAMGALLLLPFAREACATTILEKALSARANRAQSAHKQNTIDGQFRRED